MVAMGVAHGLIFSRILKLNKTSITIVSVLYTNTLMTEKVHITKLVHGGQGLGHLSDGRAVFVWGVLPDETAEVTITRSKKDYAEAKLERVITPSPYRINPTEPNAYMSTSPWQVMTYQHENTLKQQILEESFTKISGIEWQEFAYDDSRFGYRNKMEYNFWWDESAGLSLALHERGSHKKITVTESKLASEAINSVGTQLIDFLNAHAVGGRQLKSTIIRSQQDGKAGAVVFVKDKALGNLPWTDLRIEPLKVYYSNPKSPASVATELLYASNREYMHDKLLGAFDFVYAPEGFFQVNIPMYNRALRDMKRLVGDRALIVDMYAGVGSIGISLDPQKLVSVEVDMFCHEQALQNTQGDHQKFVISSAEKALEYITQDCVLVVDPPRAGLHEDVRDRIKEVKPSMIAYLSCNPSTQARDVEDLLSVGYRITFAKGYNFFPATPHIESLIVLELGTTNR